MHRLLICALIAALVMPVQTRAQDEGVVFPLVPTLSVTLDPADTIEQGGYLMGQLVLKARILSRYPFEALSLDLPEIDNSEIRTLTKPRTRKVRSYGGDGYVFETSIAIFPSRSGALTIPPVRAAGRVQTKAGEDIAFDEQSAAKAITIHGMPADYEDPWWLVSRHVSMTETWSTPLEQVREGEIVTRRVTIKADGVAGEQLPTLTHRETSGLSVRQSEGFNSTTVTSEGLIGVSEQSWAIKINSGGAIYLSPVSLTFWDPQTRERRKAFVAGHRIEPLAANGEAIAVALMAQAKAAHDGNWTLLIILLSILATPVVTGVGLLVLMCLPSLNDLHLTGAVRSANSPVEVYRSLLIWDRARRSSESGIVLTASLHGAQLQRLRNTLFSKGEEPVNATRLLREMLAVSRRERLDRLRGWMKAGFFSNGPKDPMERPLATG